MSKKTTALRSPVNNVLIRMYCLGTGDCFVLKFCADEEEKFTMMIDCGSCRGGAPEFKPYLENLKTFVGNNGIDLLIVTHEHQDHVNGFQKGKKIFEDIKIKSAWFAWTEHPEDPDDRAKELKRKTKKLRLAFSQGLKEMNNIHQAIEHNFSLDSNLIGLKKSNKAFLNGLNTLAEINLPANDDPDTKTSLAGMVAIKDKLEKDKANIKYLNPGETLTIKKLPGIRFYVLGPPDARDAIYKEGKQGRDVYKKYFSLGATDFAADALQQLGKDPELASMPFGPQHMLEDSYLNSEQDNLQAKNYQNDVKTWVANFTNEDDKWRRIDHDWISSVGSLALRLNSHINNTSLVLAMENEQTKEVLLFPGDAEFGSWESWHLIEKWNKKGKDQKHLVEDLLNRTIFYKVSHHLSYNGTALDKGINMMPTSGMTAMATLDRTRISENWKSTMPNKLLLHDLTKRCDGRLFIMSEKEIPNPPSSHQDQDALADYNEDKQNALFKEVRIRFGK